jgi:hypothetical protein
MVEVGRSLVRAARLSSTLCDGTLDHILAFCPNLAAQRVELMNKTGSTEIRRILEDKDKVRHAARWLLSTKVLGQFSVAMEVEEEDMEGWSAFQALHEVPV